MMPVVPCNLMSKLSSHLKLYPVVIAVYEPVHKQPVVKSVKATVKPYVTTIRCTEPIQLIVDIIDWAGHELLNGFDWMVSWVVPTTKPKYVIKDKILTLTHSK